MKDTKPTVRDVLRESINAFNEYIEEIYDRVQKALGFNAYQGSVKEMEKVINKTKRLPRKTKKKYKKLGIYEDWKREELGYERK